MDEEQQGLASPIAGGLRGIRRSVSSGVFTGRAMAPAKPDPQTTQLLTQNSLSLSNVSNQLANISGQVQQLNTSLGSIQQNLAVSDNLERQREAAKQNRERQLAEQGLREGKESELEKKIQGALLFPVRKVAQKAQGILSKLANFLLILAGGWLTGKTFEFLKLNQEGNQKALGEFKRKFLSQLLFAGTLLLGVGFAIAKIKALALGIGAKALILGAKGVIAAPFLILGAFIARAVAKFKKALKNGVVNAFKALTDPGGSGGEDDGGTSDVTASDVAIGTGGGILGTQAPEAGKLLGLPAASTPKTQLGKAFKFGTNFLNGVAASLDIVFARQEFNEEKQKLIEEGRATKENVKKEGIKQGAGAIASILASIGLILLPEPTTTVGGIVSLAALFAIPTAAELTTEAIVDAAIQDKDIEDGGTPIEGVKDNLEKTQKVSNTGDSSNVTANFTASDAIIGVSKDGSNIANNISNMADRTNVVNVGNTPTNSGSNNSVVSTSKKQAVELPIIPSADFANQFIGVSRSFYNVGSN
tara:strand:- start:3174 stop:4766 length:1593 start_codon:yes stop_codon:yes gene_type:complete